MKRIFFFSLLIGLLIASAPAFAQRTTGDIVGTVTDDTGAVVPGVTVTLTGAGAAGAFTSITSARGFYFFNRLFPGRYELSFTMDGFTPAKRTGVPVDLGVTTTQNVTMSLGGVAEAVTVTADAVVVDSTVTGLSNTYDKEFVQNLPLRRDSIYDLMAAAPGITQNVEGNALMAMGSETDANAFQMDGVSINSRSQGRTWLSPNTDIIEEVEVIAVGASAEYGHVPGGVFSVITRQGSNSFSGDVAYYLQTQGLTSSNTTEETDNGLPFNRHKFRDFTAQLGGPIVQDKLWFFGSYQNKLDQTTDAGVPPEFFLTSKNWTVFGKLNWQINPMHKIVGSYAMDNYSWGSNSGPTLSPSWLSREYGISPTPSVSYTGLLSENTLLEVRYGGFYGRDHYGPDDPSQRRDGPVYYNSAHGGDCSLGPCLYTGGPDYWYDLKETSTSINAHLTQYSDDFLGGSHDFKFGVQYQRAGRPDAIVGYTDWFGLYLDDNGEEYVFGYDYSPFSYSGVANSLSFFVDDTFRVNDRVTLRLGLRYDRDRASVNTLPILDRAGVPTDEEVPAVDNLWTWNNLAPRLGITYQLTDDGKTLLRGHYGRYYRGIVTMDFAGGPGNIGTTDLSTFIGYYDPADFHAGTLEGDGRGTNIGGAGNVAVNPDFGSTWTDAFVVGFERELPADLALSLTYSYKTGNNHPAWQEVNGDYSQFEHIDPTTGNTLTLSQLDSDPEDRLFLLSNPDFMDTTIKAFSVAVTKRMSNNWQLTSSFTSVRSNGMLASNVTQNGWGRQDGGVAWRSTGKSPNDFVNMGGLLIGDRPTTFKTQLLVQLPLNFLVGANHFYSTGFPWALRERISVPGLGRERILLEEKDGNRRGGNRNTVDMRVQWTAHLGQQMNLNLFLDAYNLFNNDAAEGVQSTTASSSVVGLPRRIVLPRRLQVGARFRF